ncbi:MAG: hypothetical protein H0U66_00625 [Gemmatimonadaceae bacterium]|nr:hypothetical protein [Gemmatimonadaceae bacterium]
MLLFALGFVLGILRVMYVAPRFGQTAATLAEVPVMLIAAVAACRWAISHWQVSRAMKIRWMMMLWFLVLLFAFETLLGAVPFGRTASEQWAALTTRAGLIGLAAQIIAALLPLVVGRREGRDSDYSEAAG